MSLLRGTNLDDNLLAVDSESYVPGGSIYGGHIYSPYPGGIFGLAGDDTITAGQYAYRDYLSGGPGKDTIYGLNGDDAYYEYLYGYNFGGTDVWGDFESGGLNGGEGDDYIDGGNGTDLVSGGTGDDVIHGGNGSDGVWSYAYYLEYTWPPEDTYELLRGGLRGNDGIDTIYGEAGTDLIEGGRGNDFLYGGADDDAPYHYYRHYENDDGNYWELIWQDTIGGLKGGEGNDLLDGGTGRDLLQGGAGDDILHGGDGDDAPFRQERHLSGDYPESNYDLDEITTIDAGLHGGQGNDRLYGEGGNDLLTGDAGDDILDGGDGNDIMSGQSGHDTFVFSTTLSEATNLDHIGGFSLPNDFIQLSADIFATLGPGNLPAEVLHQGAGVTAATAATDRILYDSLTGTLRYDADGAGGADAVAFAILDNHPSHISADNFIIA